MERLTGRAVERRYLNVRQAEEYTGLSRWTLARAHKRGELPMSRIGSAIRFSVEDLDEFFKSRRA